MSAIKLFFLSLFLFSQTMSAVPSSVKYRTFFGGCPTKLLGEATLRLVDLFNSKRSLRLIKEDILASGFVSKYFLKSYSVSYDPMTNFMQFNYDCPKPLFRLQSYTHQETNLKMTILVDNGNAYDPKFEQELRVDDKIKGPLPYLTVHNSILSDQIKNEVVQLVGPTSTTLMQKFSEIIINDNKELTLILTEIEGPITVFFGREQWPAKLKKLESIINYLQNKERTPVIINLTNLEKIVVKFTE